MHHNVSTEHGHGLLVRSLIAAFDHSQNVTKGVAIGGAWELGRKSKSPTLNQSTKRSDNRRDTSSATQGYIWSIGTVGKDHPYRALHFYAESNSTSVSTAHFPS